MLFLSRNVTEFPEVCKFKLQQEKLWEILQGNWNSKQHSAFWKILPVYIGCQEMIYVKLICLPAFYPILGCHIQHVLFERSATLKLQYVV